MLVSRCDYYQYLRCYCLSFPPAHYPHGVQAVTFYPRNKTHLISFLVAPSNFYDFSRKLNKLELQYGYGYGYIVKYEIYQQYLQSGENTCRQNLSWEVDKCKLEKVKVHSLINLYKVNFSCQRRYWLSLVARPPGCLTSAGERTGKL